jgi:hypothetical protein
MLGDVTWAPTTATIEPFVVAVADRFALGRRRDIELTAMPGSANRLWRFDVGREAFVVKELSHERVDGIDRRRRAAAFEQSVFEAGRLAMAEPVPDLDDEIIAVVEGSRGAPVLARVHRWTDGRRPMPVPIAIAAAAGEALAVIHRQGAAWSTEATGSLRWWEVDPLVVIARLHDGPLADVAPDAAVIARDALTIASDAEAIEGDWVFSHADHKPQNALVEGGALIVLDWDECGHCHPRLEAVEAALRWAVETEDAPAAFRAFLGAYAAAGGTPIVDLLPSDFGKWTAALLGWFSYQSRRVLGDWATDAAHERREAESMARDALGELRRTLRSLEVWASWA